MLPSVPNARAPPRIKLHYPASAAQHAPALPCLHSPSSSLPSASAPISFQAKSRRVSALPELSQHSRAQQQQPALFHRARAIMSRHAARGVQSSQGTEVSTLVHHHLLRENGQLKEGWKAGCATRLCHEAQKRPQSMLPGHGTEGERETALDIPSLG
eukprot:2433897-Rhodomonas_salina.1